MRACRRTVDEGGKQAAMPRQGTGCMPPLACARRCGGVPLRPLPGQGIAGVHLRGTLGRWPFLSVACTGHRAERRFGTQVGSLGGELVGEQSQPPERGVFVLALSGSPPSGWMSHREKVGADAAVPR